MHVLGDRAHRDVVDAGGGDLAHSLKRYAARGFQLHRPAARLIQPYSDLQVRQAELIQHDDVGARVERLFQLAQRLDFYLDGALRRAGTRRHDRTADGAGGGDVVFLDEHAVIETEAMVVAAAAAHGILLRGAQPREGLARVEDAAGRTLDRIGAAPRGGSRAGEQLQEVERGALSAQHRPRGTGDRKDLLSGGDALAVGRIPAELHTRIEAPGGLLRPSPTAP